MFGRVDIQHTDGQHTDGAAARLHSPAMRRRIYAASQSAHYGQPRAGQTAGQPLGLAQPILRGMARAHDADGHSVVRFQSAANEQHAGRIGDFAEHTRISRVGLDEYIDAVLPALGDFRFDVDFFGLEDTARQLGANALHVAQLAGRRRQHGPRGTEPVQQRPSRARTNAGDHDQA